jgi:glutamine synthetase adenylyltransferase
MAWLPDVPDEEMPAELQDMLAGQEKHYGAVLNSTRQAAHAPRVLLGTTEMSKAFARSHKVSKRLSHLLNLRVGAIVGCPL